MQPENAGLTSVSDIFIDNYFGIAKPEFILIYIAGLRNARSDRSLNLNKTACFHGFPEDVILEAWKYWENEGIIGLTEKSPGILTLNFMDLPPTLNKAPEATPEAKIDASQPYTVDEIERLSTDNSDIRYLFKMSEKILGKPLTYNEMNLLLSFHDWLSLPVQVIEVLLDYCVSNNHKHGRYMEKVAIDWADNGIKTVEDAEEYIKVFNTDYREIMKAFGLSRRDPSTRETAFMKKWLKELKMPLPLIIEACSKTIISTGKPQFAYADKILASWSENDVLTVEDVASRDAEFRKSGENNTPVKDSPEKKTTKQKSRFANYKGRDWDYEKLEKLTQDYLDSAL